MELGKRMKKYEAVSKTSLIDRIPAIIRIDGKAFHTFTTGMDRPFDRILVKTMQETMEVLCNEIQGAIFGYTQSDEITIVLYNSDPQSHVWFDGKVQKIVSVAASLATLSFNRIFKQVDHTKKYADKYDRAMFDARVFNIPLEEVINNIIWRQEDASKNSVQMLARSIYSHKEVQNMNGKQLQDKMFSEKGVNWNDLSTTKKRGTACFKVPKKIVTENGETIRNKWELDLDMPIIKNDREYIEKLLK